MNTKTFTVEDDEGNEIDITVPCEWEICGTCHGNGQHSHALGAITSSEWADWDDDEREGYMQGRYDSPCEDCDRTGKVLVPQYSKLSDEYRKLVEDYEQSEANFRRCEEYERKKGY